MSSSPVRRDQAPEIDLVLDPAKPRAILEFALERNSVLAAIRSSENLVEDPCDAHPYLLKAANFHGEPTTRECPVCETQPLVELRYVYGKELGPYSGRIKSKFELDQMAYRHGNLKVFVVEVCTGCSWNYLIRSYAIGDGRARKPLRRSRDWLD
jgi:hypothetical protein